MKLYYGWTIVIVAVLFLMLVMGTSITAYSIYVLPVSEEFDLSRADVNTGLIFMNLGMAVTAPILGRLIDLYSMRVIIFVGALVYGASLALLGISDNVVVSSVILAIPLAVSIHAAASMTMMALVARWFTAHRARALAFTAMGISIANIIIVPVGGFLVDTIEWRQALIVQGVAVAVIIIAILPFVRERPGPDDIEVAGKDSSDSPANAAAMAAAAASAKPLKTSQLLSMPKFWAIALSTGLAFGALQAVTVTLVPLGQAQGMSTAQASTLLATLGSMAILGKLALAWIGDRIDKIALLATLSALVSFVSLALMFSESHPALYAASGFFGLAAGAMMPLFLAIIAEQFGQASFGTANGMATLIMAVLGAVAVRFAGEVFDRTGGYDVMFQTFLALGLLAAVIMLASRALGDPLAKLAASES